MTSFHHTKWRMGWWLSVRARLSIGVVTAACWLLPVAANAQKTKKISESLEQIDPPLARMVVAEANGEFLDLPRIKSIDRKTAEELAKNPGGLGLSELDAIDAGVAAALAQCPGMLNLSGLTVLDSEAGAALAKARSHINVSGLRTLTSVPLAKKLAEQGAEVRLRRVKKIEGEVADALADSKGALVLDGLEVLDHEGLARCLSRPSDLQCTFDSLLSLTPAAASGFANSSRYLHFAKLQKLDVETALGFKGHAGGLVFPSLQEAAPAALAIIFRNRGPTCVGNLPRLAEAGTPIDRSVLEAISEHEGVLGLAGLTEIDLDLAAALRQHRGNAHLTGVTTLDKEVAEALVGCRGMLWMNGLVLGNAAGEAAVRAIVKHRGGPTSGFVLDAATMHHLPEDLLKQCDRHARIYFGNTVGK